MESLWLGRSRKITPAKADFCAWARLMPTTRHVSFAGPPTARNLAVLCGWGGSKLKNVTKYADFWHRLGWRTVTVEMTVDMTRMTFYPACNLVGRALQT